MRRFIALFLLGLVGCGPQYVETVATSPQDLPSRTATFAETPVPLQIAFEDACSSPGDVYRRVSRDTVQCRILPSPGVAAFLLLQYDGALEAPTLVMQKRTTPRDGALEVEMSYFAEVVQKSGKPRRIYFQHRSLDDMVDSMLRAAGGVTP